MLFTIPGANGEIPERKCPLQKFVMMSMESSSFYPELGLSSARQKYDVVGTTRLDSDVPLIKGMLPGMNFYQPVAAKTGFIVATISNCAAHNNRLEYLASMQAAGCHVDSYGPCMKNRDAPPGSHGWYEDRMQLLRGYKFSLAFESSSEIDYVRGYAAF